MLETEDKDEILDAIGDIHLILHQKSPVESKFLLITAVLYRYTPTYDKLVGAFEAICTLFVHDEIDDHIEMIDYILSDVIELTIYLSLVDLTEDNKHVIYEPTVQAMHQLVINITGDTGATQEDEIEFF